MRVSTLNAYTNKINNIGDRMEDLAQLNEKILTNKARLVPSDDPVAAIKSIESHKIIAKNVQYIKNIDSMSQSLGRDETYLKSLDDIQNRMKEVVLSSNNGTASPDARRAYGEELDQLIGSYAATLNAQDTNGDYIFAGMNVKTAPVEKNAQGQWVAHDVSGARQVQITNGSWMTANTSISNLMQTTTIKDKKVLTFLTQLQQYQQQLVKQPTVSSAALLPLGTQTLSSLSQNFTSVEGVLTDIGGKQNSIMLAKTAMTDINLMYQVHITKNDEVNLPKVTSQVQLQTVAMQISQKLFAKVNQLNLFQQL